MSSGAYNTLNYKNTFCIKDENLSEHKKNFTECNKTLREHKNKKSPYVVWVVRFESLEPEMNNQASRVAVVNQVARQLIHNGHPSEKEIKSQQDKLNTR